jgi:Tfp pilus assembly protein PilF
MWRICKPMLILTAGMLLTACAGSVKQSSSAGVAADVEIPATVRQDFDAALARVAAGDDAAAIRDLEVFIQRYPDYSAAYTNLAIVYERQKQTEQALWLLKKAIEVDPSAVEAMNRLGLLSRQQGDFAAAEAYWRQATIADPGYANAWYNLGILSELYKQDYPAALDCFRHYQALTDGAEADPVVARWIDDLERRGNVPVQAANSPEAL